MSNFNPIYLVFIFFPTFTYTMEIKIAQMNDTV